MGEQFQKIMTNIKTFWSGLDKKNRILLVGGGTAIFALALLLTLWLNRVEYTVLYQDLSGEETAEIYAKLQDTGEKVRMEGNALMVPVDRAASLQMKMSIEGYPKTGFNYSYLTENIDFMSNDFEQQAYYQIMLQEQLVTAIKTIQGIRNAYVIINLPTQNDFVLPDNRIEASATVRVEPMPGMSLSAMQVKGIEELVAKAVPGLTTENIAIVDNTGRYLKSEGLEMTDSAAAEREMYRMRLDLQQKLDAMLVSKVQAPLEKVYGANNVAVSASVSIDYDEKKSEEQNFTPSTTDPTTGKEQGMTIHEDEEQTTQSSGLAGGVPGENDNADVPEYPDNQTDGSNSTEFKRSTDFAVNSLLTQFEKNGYSITNMSVAVVINKGDMSEQEIANMSNTVAKAAGIETDDVSVIGAEFMLPEADEAMQRVEEITYLSLMAAGVILILVLLAIWIISSRRKKKAKEEQKRMEEEITEMQLARQQNMMGEFTDAAMGAMGQGNDLLRPLDVVETKEVQLKKEIKEFTATNPEIVAQLLRIWLKGEDDD